MTFYQGEGGYPKVLSYDDIRNANLAFMHKQESRFRQTSSRDAIENLEKAYDGLHRASFFKELAPKATEFGLKMKRILYQENRMDLWYATVTQLYFMIEHHIHKDVVYSYQWENELYKEIERLGFSQIGRANARLALKEAIQVGFEKQNQKQWLLARIEYLNATLLTEFSWEAAETEALYLLQEAKRNSLYTQMYVYAVLGRLYTQNGDLEKAFRYAQQGLVLAILENREAMISACLMNIFNALNALPHTARYLDLLLIYWRQLDLIGQDVHANGYFIVSSGVAAYRQRNYALAAHYYQAARTLWARLEHRRNEGFSSIGLGMSFVKLSQHDEAETWLKHAAEIFVELEQPADQVWALHAQGWNLLLKGNYLKAETVLREAYALGITLEESRRKQRLLKLIQEDLDKLEGL